MFTAKLTGNVAIFDWRYKIHIQLLTTVTQNRKINNKSWHSSEITSVKPSPGYFPRARMKTHFLKRKSFYLKKLSLFHLRQKSPYPSWSKQRIPQRNFAVLIRVFSKFKFSNENKVKKFPMNKDLFLRDQISTLISGIFEKYLRDMSTNTTL